MGGGRWEDDCGLLRAKPGSMSHVSLFGAGPGSGWLGSVLHGVLEDVAGGGVRKVGMYLVRHVHMRQPLFTFA